MKCAALCCAAAASGVLVGAWLVLSVCDRATGAETYLAANRARVEKMVLADVARYGIDIYRLYMEISQTMPGAPGSDFATDKAMRKLSVTYPDSNVTRLAEASAVYGAIAKRDMMRIETYLEKAEQAGGELPLMPNGYEIVPQLAAAQYNYFFHIGRLDDARRSLDYLQQEFSSSWLFQPQGSPLPMKDFIAAQRRVLEAVSRKETP